MVNRLRVAGVWTVRCTCFVVIMEGFLKVMAHGNGEFTVANELDVHAKVLMDFSASLFRHGAKQGLDLFDDTCHNGGVLVGDFVVIYIPQDGTLGGVNGGLAAMQGS